MRKVLFFLLAVECLIMPLSAQKKPKWLDKNQSAVVKISIYDNQGKETATVNGFYISQDGLLVTSYAPFAGASKAVVTDQSEHKTDVKYVVAANELYDVLQLRVADTKDIKALELAETEPAQDSYACLMPYPELRVRPYTEGQITEVSKLEGDYKYYKTNIALGVGQVNSPVMSSDGKVIGISQEDASGAKENSYFLPVSYIRNMKMSSTDILSSTYTGIGIMKEWPKSEDQAQVVLYLLANSQNANQYLTTLNDFISNFPDSPDGYVKRASHYAYQRAALSTNKEEEMGCLSKALADIAEAGKYSKSKAEESYNRAYLIFGVASADTTLAAPWSVSNALTVIQEAITKEDLPIYRQLEGDIYYYLQKYGEAFADYQFVNASDIASASSYYMAAKANAAMPLSNFGDQLTLLDSAVVKSGSSSESAPYILERVQLRLKLMQYAEAVKDYDLYYQVMNGNVNDSFYYYREQAKFLGNDLDGALKDIQQAILIQPKNPVYMAEEASVYVRKEQYEEALKSIESALQLAPDFASCYRLRGVCYLRMKKNAQACEAFHKAQELGDKVAERLIKENCK